MKYPDGLTGHRLLSRASLAVMHHSLPIDLVRTLVYLDLVEPTTVNIYEAKTQLSRLLKRVASGEQIIIAKANVPIARLVPIAPSRPKRVANKYAGLIKMPEDFDEPLPPEVLDSFYSGPLEPE